VGHQGYAASLAERAGSEHVSDSGRKATISRPQYAFPALRIFATRVSGRFDEMGAITGGEWSDVGAQDPIPLTF